MKDKLRETNELFTVAVEGKKKPKRVPLLANDRTYKIFDAGYKLSECFYDYDKMADAVYKFHEKYEYDAYVDLGTRNAFPVTDCFDAVIYDIDDEKGHFNYRDKDAGADSAQVLQDLIDKHLLKFAYENILTYKLNVKDYDDAKKRIYNAIKELTIFQKSKGEIKRVMIDKYGVPTLDAIALFSPPEIMFNGGIQGIKSFSMDMRRYPDKLHEALEALSVAWKDKISTHLNGYKSTDEIIFPYRTSCLAHTIMNPKQFERFYWLYLKWEVEQLANRSMKCFMFVEGSMEILFDFYSTLPANTVAVMIELDDPKLVKKMVPNMTVAGGYPTSYLAMRSVQECVDKAKDLLENVAYDGRWVYTTDKMLSYKNDVREETMLAVHNYLREHGTF